MSWLQVWQALLALGTPCCTPASVPRLPRSDLGHVACSEVHLLNGSEQAHWGRLAPTLCPCCRETLHKLTGIAVPAQVRIVP